MALHKAYFSTALLSLFSKGFNILSTFGILWFLNAFMGKEPFGLFMMAFAMMFALSMMISAGFQALVLYHVSREYEDDLPKAEAITGQLFWLSVVFASLIGLALYAFAPFIAQLLDKPDLAPWIMGMAAFVPVNTAAIVLPGYSRARQRVKETLFFQEILLNALRVGFVGAIWALAAPIAYVSAAYIGSALLPVVILFIRAPVWPSFKTHILSWWDLSYGLKISAFQILNQPFRGFDIVLVGAFTTAANVADYTMAVRLAQMLWIPKHAAAQLQVPRMGALLKKDDKPQLEMEFNAMRSFSLIAVLLGCCFLLVLGGPVLSLFGDYQTALPALYVLAAAAVIRTGFGASGDLVGMAGHAGASAIAAFVSMVITVGLTIGLVPYMGAMGGAIGVFIGTISLFCNFATILKRTEDIKAMYFSMALINIAASAILCVAAYNTGLLWGCGLLMLGLTIILLVIDKSWLKFIRYVA